MTASHPYDPGTYTVLLFTQHNRKRKGRLHAVNYQRATAAAGRWARRTGGSAVVMRCLFNSSLRRGAFPALWQ